MSEPASYPLTRVQGNVVDVHGSEVFAATVTINQGRIIEIRRDPGARYDTYLVPGFVDGHLHVESSMLPPPEFARLAMTHGTVAVVADPHEIGNVLGTAGVHYMLDTAAASPLRFFFGAPSCVPATNFETSGATIGVDEVDALLADPRIYFLSEMMNWPGVLARDPGVMAKLAAARKHGKPVDGHAPGIKGRDAKAYAAAGITTDHEAVSLDEALDKIAAGMLIGIREGSAAKNLDALLPLLESHPDRCFFCTDDSHPDDLMHGHIDRLVRRAVAAGHDCIRVLRAASVVPVRHYNLDVGLLCPGDLADFVEVDNLSDLTVLRTVINGAVVAERGQSLVPRVEVPVVNEFHAGPRAVEDFQVPAQSSAIRVIEAHDGSLLTGELTVKARVESGWIVSDVAGDVLKMVVLNRYKDVPPAFAFIKGLGIQRGAIASSVAHDSHNIVAVGVTDDDLCRVVNAVIDARGGLAVAGGGDCQVLPLPIAGIMSDRDGYEVGRRYAELTRLIRDLGCTFTSPLMTLSFMALLVIPDLKLSDQGLFSGRSFRFVNLFAEP